MKTINHLIIMLCAFSLLQSCKSGDSPTPIAEKKIVEARLKFGPNYALHALHLGLQGTSIDGGLRSDFSFLGVQTNEDGSIVLPESVVKSATYSTIPSQTISIRTSDPVSTMSVGVAAPLIENAGGTTIPLDFTIEFYIDGKLTSSINEPVFPQDFSGKVYVLDVTDAGNIITK